MANTYTQLHIHCVFAVKFREALIGRSWKEELHRYMTGVIQKNDHKMLQINSMPDHLHFLVGYRPHVSLSSMVQNVKTESSKWIKRRGICNYPFEWQEGYGAFSYSKSHINNVIRYIQNQEAHHKKETFSNEYKRLLTLFEIEYDDRYVFMDPI